MTSRLNSAPEADWVPEQKHGLEPVRRVQEDLWGSGARLYRHVSCRMRVPSGHGVEQQGPHVCPPQEVSRYLLFRGQKLNFLQRKFEAWF